MARWGWLWCWLFGHSWQEYSFMVYSEYVPADDKHGNIYGGGKTRQVVLCARCFEHG